MRVSSNTNNSVQKPEVAGTKNAQKATVAKEATKKDKVDAQSTTIEGSVNANISAKGKEFARAQEIAAKTPDVREEKIAELKRKIAEGKYKVDADAVAGKMVDEHLKAGIG